VEEDKMKPMLVDSITQDSQLITPCISCFCHGEASILLC